MNKIIVWHAPCHDGVTALWAAKQSRAWQDAEAIEGVYGAKVDVERFRDAEVLFVDFTHKRPVMEEIAAVAKHVTVIDHHVSAQEDLEEWAKAAPNVTWHYDVDKSGAGLTWDTLFCDGRPEMIDLVEDRDLWRFAHGARTREWHAYASCFPLTLEAREQLARDFYEKTWEVQGQACLRQMERFIEQALNRWTLVRIGDDHVPAVSCPVLALASEIGSALARKLPQYPYVAVYYTSRGGEGQWDRRVFSLRSRDEGADVSKVAARFGGGGHQHAAGFSVLWTRWRRYQWAAGVLPFEQHAATGSTRDGVFEELITERDRLRARLQIDPGGSDKIDELEDAVAHLRARIAELEGLTFVTK